MQQKQHDAEMGRSGYATSVPLRVDDFSAPGATTLHLTGHVARRRPDVVERTLWDTELIGFGLRVRPTGHKSWIVSVTRRGRKEKVTLGAVGGLSAGEARSRARTFLAEAAKDGLPRPAVAKQVLTFADYAPLFWRDYARLWKPATQRASRGVIDRELLPVFGSMAVDQLKRADVQRWRDAMVGRPGTFNRAIPVLAVMLKHAERLGYRKAGSNPCRNTARYKRPAMDRFLSPEEYRRLGAVLAAAEVNSPDVVAAIRLLIFTGARVSEILTLRWEDVQTPRLRLADSKTGPKYLYLNRQAEEVLNTVRPTDSLWVFPAPCGTKPSDRLDNCWRRLRKKAGLADVRLHDLRHSYASVAINGGLGLPVIGRLLGHALAETTARYAHLEDASVVKAAALVGASLAEAMRSGA